jgi:hypothetical protein
MLETLIAVVLSNKFKGTPLWMIFCGSSGDAKSTQILSIEKLQNVILIDQITKNTLASGKPKVKDLGFKLKNSSHIVVIPDLACISAKYKDDRKEIFASMRNLYDGFIRKHTGAGKPRKYNNCHVTLIAGAKHILKKEYLIHQQLGSRELIFDTDALMTDNEYKMDASWNNEKYELKMKKELQEIITKYLSTAKLQDIEISTEIKEFLKKQAIKLSILRAVGDYNQYTDELDVNIHPEVPTRLIKQLKRLYVCLKSLDKEYTDDRAEEIIKHIVKSSGNPNRQSILEELESNPQKEYSINEMRYLTKLGYRACKRELEALWNLGLVEKSPVTIKENSGRKVAIDTSGYKLNYEVWLTTIG